MNFTTLFIDVPVSKLARLAEGWRVRRLFSSNPTITPLVCERASQDAIIVPINPI